MCHSKAGSSRYVPARQCSTGRMARTVRWKCLITQVPPFPLNIASLRFIAGTESWTTARFSLSAEASDGRNTALPADGLHTVRIHDSSEDIKMGDAFAIEVNALCLMLLVCIRPSEMCKFTFSPIILLDLFLVCWLDRRRLMRRSVLARSSTLPAKAVRCSATQASSCWLRGLLNCFPLTPSYSSFSTLCRPAVASSLDIDGSRHRHRGKQKLFVGLYRMEANQRGGTRNKLLCESQAC